MIRPVETVLSLATLVEAMDRPAVALVAALAVTAGCSALPAGPDSPESRSVGTLTPVPVPDDGGGDDIGDDAAPIWIDDGDVDVAALLAAHEAALVDRSYTWEYSQTQTARRTGERVANVTRRVEIGADAALVEIRHASISTHILRYFADGRGYLRTVISDRLEFATVESPRDARSYDSTPALLETFLSGRAPDARLVSGNDRRYVRLYLSPGSPPPELVDDPQDPNGVRNVTLTAYVTHSGLVESVTASFETRTAAGRTRRVSVRATYEAVGATTVAEPDWVARLRDPTATPTTQTPVPPRGTPTWPATDNASTP